MRSSSAAVNGRGLFRLIFDSAAKKHAKQEKMSSFASILTMRL